MKPGTFTQMYVMLVFAVRNREALLKKGIRDKVFEYVGGIISNLKQKSLVVNGTSNHIHILYGMNPNVSVSDTVFHIKRGSSLFINNEKLCSHHFTWQEGYGAFTYSRSQINDVYNYIRNQEQHHASVTFRKEYTDLLTEADIIYDDLYLFEFLDELE
jgi:REP element-mobilizing transposase RayT